MDRRPNRPKTSDDGQDVDVDNEGRAQRCQEMAERRLGACPAIRRREGTGRRVLFYAAAEGEPEKKVRANSATDEKVEVLGRGQQVVAFGHHWTGGSIYWLGVPGFDATRDDLPQVSEDQIDAVLEECARIIEADEPKVHDFAPPGASTRVHDGDRDPLTEADVRACLGLILDNSSYDNWIRVGAAVHSWDDGITGLALFDDWSRGTGNYSRSDVQQQWRRFRGMTRVGVGTLLFQARLADPHFLPPSRVKATSTLPEWKPREERKPQEAAPEAGRLRPRSRPASASCAAARSRGCRGCASWCRA